MEDTDFENGICSICGYELNTPCPPAYMKPSTCLHDRYIVGALIGVNGEGANYIAFDKQLSRRVLMREFMPRNLCSRVKGKALIGVSYNHLAEYKALMAEFTELNRSLARQRNLVHINSILDMFTENNTTYVVSEYVEGITLTEYLKENAGELSWATTSQIFPKLFDTIDHINSNGIVHRGICPDTIYITDDNEFKITGFSISAIRTNGAELEPEIFDGYAAPEQYQVSSRQGTWTDVYALCAVMYRVLTGSKPIAALSRMDKDNLSSPYELNENVPKNVSLTIMRGMNLNGSDRIQTVSELKTLLFSPDIAYMNEEDEYTDSFPTAKDDLEPYDEVESEYVDGYQDDYSFDDSDNNRNKNTAKTQSTADRMKVPVIVAIILLVVLVVGIFVAFRIIDSNNNRVENENSTLESTSKAVSETEAETASFEDGDSVMPDLVGSDFEKSSSYYDGWFTLDPTYEYNDDYAEGQIFWQEIEPDKLFTSSSKIKVKVSKGSQYIELPSYSGINYYKYKLMLDELGVPTSYYGKTDSGYADGTVLGLSIDIENGDKYDRESSDPVVIYYAYTPETEPETETEIITEPVTEAPVETEAPEENQGGEEVVSEENFEDNNQ
jgi:serine/threonine-protein kinase